MKRLATFVALCLILMLPGCNLVDDDKTIPGANQSTGKELPLNVVKSGTLSITNKTDSVSTTFNVEVGKSYAIDFPSGNSGNTWVMAIAISSNGDTLSNLKNYYANYTATFKAVQNDVVTVVFFTNNGDQYPYSFEYRVISLNSVPDLNGTWLLVKSESEALGETETHTYPASASNVQHIITIRNDSLISYYVVFAKRYNYEKEKYEEMRDSVNVSGRLLVNSWIKDYSYARSGSQLILRQSGPLGRAVETYTAYTGSIDDIVWASETYTVPTELIGAWFMKSHREQMSQIKYGDISESDSANSYSSAEESTNIYVITADSIIQYHRKAPGNYQRYANTVKRRMDFFDRFSINGDAAVYREVDYEKDGDNIYAWHSISEYERYSGSLPPESWGLQTQW